MTIQVDYNKNIVHTCSSENVNLQYVTLISWTNGKAKSQLSIRKTLNNLKAPYTVKTVFKHASTMKLCRLIKSKINYFFICLCQRCRTVGYHVNFVFVTMQPRCKILYTRHDKKFQWMVRQFDAVIWLTSLLFQVLLRWKKFTSGQIVIMNFPVFSYVQNALRDPYKNGCQELAVTKSW